jgi:hypothetical protein
MEPSERVIEAIRDVPGTSFSALMERFGVTSYRLKRLMRRGERSLKNQVLVNDETHGVWIVDVDTKRCLGMVWVEGGENGFFRQCENAPAFPDGRCPDHSSCGNPEMTAFEREIAYLAGPAKPTAFSMAHLGIRRLKELIARLSSVEPWTARDEAAKARFDAAMNAALGFLRWKEMLRRRAEAAERIPWEILDRHRRSSVNLFEFAIRKQFAVLELSPESTKEAVLRAWKKLAKRHHPDTGLGDEETMKKINLAKERIFRLRRWDR